MEVEYVLTEDDVVAMARYQAKRALKEGKGTPLTWLVILFVFLMSLLFIVSQPGELYAYLPALFIVGALAYRFLLSSIMVRNTRRLLRQGDNSKVLNRNRVLITPEALTHDTEFGAGRTLWSGVDRIDATKDHAFIIFVGNTAVIVPRRAFADEERFGDFVSTARRFREEAIGGGD